MKKEKVVKNIPVRLPITITMAMYLFLDNIEVNDIIWGIFITLFTIYWVVCIYVVFWGQEKVDIFEEPKEKKEIKKSIFQQRLEKLKEKQSKN